MKRYSILLLGLMLLFGSFGIAGAEDITGTENRIVITSDKFFFYRDRNYVEYVENVQMVDGARILTCDTLRAYINADTQKMNRAEATGNVVITEENRRALAGHAVYIRSQEKVILTGEPVLYQGINMISGDMITFYMNSEQIVVEGNVRAELYPDENSTDDTETGE